jgi:hypothetical protein
LNSLCRRSHAASLLVFSRCTLVVAFVRQLGPEFCARSSRSSHVHTARLPQPGFRLRLALTTCADPRLRVFVVRQVPRPRLKAPGFDGNARNNPTFCQCLSSPHEVLARLALRLKPCARCATVPGPAHYNPRPPAEPHTPAVKFHIGYATGHAKVTRSILMLSQRRLHTLFVYRGCALLAWPNQLCVDASFRLMRSAYFRRQKRRLVRTASA